MIFRRVTGWPSWGGGWNPFGEIDRIRQEMGRLQDAFARGLIGERLAGVFPLMNVTEDKDHYFVRAELPGINKEDVKVTLENGILTLSAETRS